jgi:SAM-dependent methyltransferase
LPGYRVCDTSRFLWQGDNVAESDVSGGDLKKFYEADAARFWNPRDGMIGRDLTIYPLLKGMSGSVLEYGCGSGSLLLALAKEPRFSSVTGVDISEAALSAVADAWADMRGANPADKLKLLTPRNDQLPSISSGSVDLLLSLDTIEHVLNPYTVLDELHRIGSPGAKFVISVPNYGYIKYVVQLLMGRQPVTGAGVPVSQWRDAGWDGYHLHTFTRESLDALLRDCGWRPILWTGYGDRLPVLGPLRRRFPALWSGALTVVSEKT